MTPQDAIFTFRSKLLELMPRWAIDMLPVPGAPNGVGGPYHYAYGLALDAVEDWMYQGVRARFVDHTVVGHQTGAPEDALPYIGLMQQIVRGFQEASTGYRVRLRTALDSWRHAGSAYGVLSQLVGYVSPSLLSMTIVSASSVWEYVIDGQFLSGPYPLNRIDLSATPNWIWDTIALGTGWARAWVIIYTGGLWQPEGNWGDGQVWNDGVADPGVTTGTWGSTATSGQVAALRDIARRWRPLHVLIPNIVLSFFSQSDDFNPQGTPGINLPNGTYGDWMTYASGVAVAGRVNGAPAYNNLAEDAFLDGVQ